MNDATIGKKSSKIGLVEGSGGTIKKNNTMNTAKMAKSVNGGSGVQLTELITSIPPTPNGDWIKWIIGIGLTVVATLITTVVTLVRVIEGKYRTEVSDLKTTCGKLEAETEECRKDREDFRVRIATLEAQIEQPPHGPHPRGRK
jgi:hypothetical protein